IHAPRLLLSHCTPHHPDLPSFPTRRSSDLDALHLSYKAVLKKVERINRTEDKVRVWTVNDAESAKQFFKLGVEAIMTDFPRKMIQAREEYEAAEEGTGK